LLIFTLNAACSRVSRTGEQSHPIHHNLIDDIHSASQIDSLLSPLGYSRYEKTDTAILFEKESYRRFADSLNAEPWIKADLDGNGYTDLVVASLKDLGEYKPVCILDSGGNRFYTKSLSLEKLGECSFPKVITINSTPLVVQYSLTDWTDMEPELLWRDMDTLIIKEGKFIEWNPSPKKHYIKMITFSTTSCLGGCDQHDITIFNDRTAIYNGKWMAKMHGVRTATVSEAHYRKLIDHLNYIDFPNLEDYYLTAESCGPTYRLKIVYDDDKVKEIDDQTLSGTFGLRILYHILSDLTETEDWR
jgi:hypothetical protein